MSFSIGKNTGASIGGRLKGSNTHSDRLNFDFSATHIDLFSIFAAAEVFWMTRPDGITTMATRQTSLQCCLRRIYSSDNNGTSQFRPPPPPELHRLTNHSSILAERYPSDLRTYTTHFALRGFVKKAADYNTYNWIMTRISWNTFWKDDVAQI